MTERPDDTPDLRKPSSDEPPASPSYGQEPTSPYVTPPEPPTAPYPAQGGPGYPGYPGPGYPGPGYGGPPAPGGYAPYGAPGMPGYPFAQAHGGANVAMGLGITSLVCAVGTFVCCVTLPGVLTGPFAIALALRARKEMQDQPGLYNNEGSATTGLVTGIIGTVLGLVMVGIVVFFVGAIYSFDDF